MLNIRFDAWGKFLCFFGAKKFLVDGKKYRKSMGKMIKYYLVAVCYK